MIERILRIGKQIVLWFSVLFVGFLCQVSLISTAYFNTETSLAEHPQYRMDSLVYNILFFAVFYLLLFMVSRRVRVRQIPMKALLIFSVGFVIAVSLIWVKISYTYPEADQKAVSWVAWLMSQDNFLFFEHGKYMQIYPNQLGLAAILEGLYRLAGEENQKLFMYITALSNGAVVYLL